MSQRFYLEPDWQSWNDRIAIPLIPRHMQGKFDYKLYKEKSSRLEVLDKYIESLLSERTSLVISIITMKDTAPQSYVQKEQKNNLKVPFPKANTFGNLSINVDTKKKQNNYNYVFKRVDEYSLNYTESEIASFSALIPDDDEVKIRVKRQNGLLRGFARKIGRFLAFKLEFSHMHVYSEACGFALKNNVLSLYCRKDDSVLFTKPYHGAFDDILVAVLQMFVEFYYNFEVEGKVRKIPTDVPEYVLGLVYKYIVTDLNKIENNFLNEKPIGPVVEPNEMEDCEDLPFLVDYLSSKFGSDQTPSCLEEID